MPVQCRARVCLKLCRSEEVSDGSRRSLGSHGGLQTPPPLPHHTHSTRTQPASDAFPGRLSARYNSTSYYDDLTWAATWLYSATGQIQYLSDAYNYWTLHRNVRTCNARA